MDDVAPGRTAGATSFLSTRDGDADYLINVFSAAGLWIETPVEPKLPEEARLRHPHKQAWMDKYLGILIFKLRPLPGQARQRST